ncbi:MAG: hypothetical protein AAF995_00475 [Planctomycetota bacterium]
MPRSRLVLAGLGGLLFGAAIGLLSAVTIRRAVEGDADLLIELAILVVGTGIVGLVVAVVADALAWSQAQRLQQIAEAAAITQLRREVVRNKQMEISTELYQRVHEMFIVAMKYVWARANDLDLRPQLEEQYKAHDSFFGLAAVPLLAVLDGKTRVQLSSGVDYVRLMVDHAGELSGDGDEDLIEASMQRTAHELAKLEAYLSDLWGTELGSSSDESLLQFTIGLLRDRALNRSS